MIAGLRGAQSCSQLVIEERQLQIVRSGMNIVLNPRHCFPWLLKQDLEFMDLCEPSFFPVPLGELYNLNSNQRNYMSISYLSVIALF